MRCLWFECLDEAPGVPFLVEDYLPGVSHPSAMLTVFCRRHEAVFEAQRYGRRRLGSLVR